jgi:uroporphyrinogen III methyltransferase/synthase
MVGNTGKVYLVGAGPGDPKLITLRGMEALAKADVIVYDRLASPKLLSYAKDNVELIYCGKLPDRHTIPQEEINQILVRQAKLGKTVVRLKGGDPSIFGRVGEEAAHCVEHGVSFEVVPGITSGIAAPMYAGIPLTHRDLNSSLAFVTGHKRVDDKGIEINWEKLATAVETIVFYMGVGNLSLIQEQLVLYGRSPETPVALVRWGTLGKQETLTGTLNNIVAKVEEANFKAPAIIIVGEVVRLREKLSWFEHKPFFDTKVLIPGSDSTAGHTFPEWIEDEGGESIVFPKVRIVPSIGNKVMDRTLTSLETFDVIIFTNGDTVRFFFQRLKELGIDIRSVAARLVGTEDEAIDGLTEKGFMADTLSGIKSGHKVLYLRSEKAKDLPQQIFEQELEITELDLFETVINNENKDEVKIALEQRAVDMVIFTGLDAVERLRSELGEEEFSQLLQPTTIVCMDKSIAETVRRLGLDVQIVAKEPTWEGLLEEIGLLKKQRSLVQL